ncbi:MAG: mechanosensitive ion channel family protein [Holophaga sp.]|nr:mechanosensitive ion channel family protein [Holophaga sp.]
MFLVFTNRLEAFTTWFGQTGWQKLQKLCLVMITCVIILWAMRLVAKAVNRSLGSALKEGNPDAMRRAKTLGSVLENFARVLVISFFILETLQEFNVSVGPLIAGVGIMGAALGFGSQSIVKDVIGGFFLLVENQFGVGDIISIGDRHTGTVERMTLRVTMLRDMEGQAHYIPNGSIADVVVMSKEFAKAMVEVEVSQDEDVVRVMAVLTELGVQMAADLATVLEPTEVQGIISMTPHSCVIRTLTKCAPGQQWAVGREYRKRIAIRFQEEGFSRPMPQRLVWNRNWEKP